MPLIQLKSEHPARLTPAEFKYVEERTNERLEQLGHNDDIRRYITELKAQLTDHKEGLKLVRIMATGTAAPIEEIAGLVIDGAMLFDDSDSEG